jgi:hypothetical protein
VGVDGGVAVGIARTVASTIALTRVGSGVGGGCGAQAPRAITRIIVVDTIKNILLFIYFLLRNNKINAPVWLTTGGREKFPVMGKVLAGSLLYRLLFFGIQFLFRLRRAFIKFTNCSESLKRKADQHHLAVNYPAKEKGENECECGEEGGNDRFKLAG